MKNKKKKKKNSNTNYYLKLALVLLLLIALITAIFAFVKGKRIDPNSAKIKDIYSYLGSNDPNYCDGIITYDNKKITYDKIPEKTRICNAFINTSEKDIDIIKVDKTKKANTCSIGDVTFATEKNDDAICTVQRVSLKKLKENYKKIYGKNLKNNKSFDLNSTTVCHADNKYYYCGLKEKFTYIFGAETKTYRNIKKVTKKNNRLYIIDYFIKTEDNNCYLNYKTEKPDQKCSKKLEKKSRVDYSFVKKNGKMYKHTFKKINKNYSWISSEPIK